MVLLTNVICIYFIAIVFILHRNFTFCKKTVLNFERPKIISYDKTLVKDVTVISRRYNRSNPLYFVTAEFELLQKVDNSFVWNIYVYQIITSQYKQSFVDFHFHNCDLLLTDNFLRKPLTEAFYRMPERPMKTLSCPILPGKYKLKDMKTTLLELPLAIPFLEGRTFVNFTRGTRLLASGSIDFRLKEI